VLEGIVVFFGLVGAGLRSMRMAGWGGVKDVYAEAFGDAPAGERRRDYCGDAFVENTWLRGRASGP